MNTGLSRPVSGFQVGVVSVMVACAPADSAPPFVRDFPVIDMHLHSLGADGQGPPGQAMCLGVEEYIPWDQGEPFRGPPSVVTCRETVTGAPTDDALRDQTFVMLERFNVIGVTSGPHTAAWMEAQPDRIIPGLLTSLDETTPGELEGLFTTGAVQVLAEVTTQYRNVSPSDAGVAAHFAVAARHDIPVGIHVGIGPPGGPMMFDLRLRGGRPSELEELLVRHPTLRVYAMHAGWPFADEMIGMMQLYPQLYVGLGVLGAGLTRIEYYDYLRRLVQAGFGRRVMFGSDQMVWPDLIGYQIELIENAPFLSAKQKRDILFENARRFLRLDADDPRWGQGGGP